MTSSVLLTWGSGNSAVLLFSFVEGGEFVCCIPLRPLPRRLPRTVDGDDDGGESAPLGVFFFAIGIRYHEITKISSVWCCCPLNKILVDIISGCSKKKKRRKWTRTHGDVTLWNTYILRMYTLRTLSIYVVTLSACVRTVQYYYWRETILVVSPVALKAIRSYECCSYIVFTTCTLRYHYWSCRRGGSTYEFIRATK